jgi:hypothetical protein
MIRDVLDFVVTVVVRVNSTRDTKEDIAIGAQALEGVVLEACPGAVGLIATNNAIAAGLAVVLHALPAAVLA